MPAFDPDLDAPPSRSRNPFGEGVADYLRLIANPLPAVVGLVGAWAVLRYSLRGHNLALFLVALVATALCPFLIQYHCLDCGRTDFAFRSGRHACPEVLRRWQLAESARRRPPRLRTQIKAWVWLLFTAVLVYAILAGARR
jgi:hypothetical protein